MDETKIEMISEKNQLLQLKYHQNPTKPGRFQTLNFGCKSNDFTRTTPYRHVAAFPFNYRSSHDAIHEEHVNFYMTFDEMDDTTIAALF